MSEPETRQLQFGPRELVYTLKRSNRRTLGMTVDHRGLTVTIPLRATLRQTEDFIRSNAGWVFEKLDEWAARGPKLEFEAEDGTVLPILGQPCTLRLVEGAARAQWVEGPFERELRLPLRPDVSPRVLLKRVLEHYALRYFGGRLDEYMHRLAADYPQIRRPRLALTSARTRWGSCSRATGIRLNWRLIHLDHALGDYVVAHEVAHLVEMNHSPRFWAVVELLYPDYKRVAAALREVARDMPEI